MKETNSHQSIIREIILKPDSLNFKFLENGKQKNKISINVGSDYLCKRFFKGDIPKDDEVEISIYYIEETALSKKALMNDNEWFVCNHKLLPEIFHKNIGDIISFKDVEKINHKYFDYIAGVPDAVLHIDYSKEKFVIILILRAIMHVLKFNQVEITN